MSRATLIINARLVNEGQVIEADLRIREGRIAQIGQALTCLDGESLFDAAGRHLLPGVIDDQVHFREPGLTHKGDIGSESRAAVAGGITSFMEMPNTRPWTLTAADIEDKCARAAATAHANYAFYLGASHDNLEHIRAIDPRAVAGVKVFMGASTGNQLVDDPAVLEAIFREAPTPITTHCEYQPLIDARLAEARSRYGDDIPLELHPWIRSAEACKRSTEIAIDLARRHGARLHVLHISTAAELELFEDGPLAGKQITGEVCSHFLQFDEGDYPALGNRIKCNPAIKTRADRQALIAALASGRLDIVATDHAPHLLSEKQRPYGESAAGLPLVQHHLVSLLELVHEGHLDLPTLVARACHAPAERFSVRERGFLREGYHADLVLVDLDRGHRADDRDVLYRCGWTPYHGRRFRSSVAATFVNGEIVYDGVEVHERQAGRRLEFDR